MNGGKEIILFMIQDIVVDRDTRRNQLRHSAFHQLLSHLRVFQLVADSNTFTGTDQLGKISIEGMMRKSGHFNKLARPVGFFCLYDSQYLGTNHGVFAIHFVKVSYTEQKYSIRMFRLYIEILLHQWGFNDLCHGIYLLSFYLQPHKGTNFCERKITSSCISFFIN